MFIHSICQDNVDYQYHFLKGRFTRIKNSMVFNCLFNFFFNFTLCRTGGTDAVTGSEITCSLMYRMEKSSFLIRIVSIVISTSIVLLLRRGFLF